MPRENVGLAVAGEVGDDQGGGAEIGVEERGGLEGAVALIEVDSDPVGAELPGHNGRGEQLGAVVASDIGNGGVGRIGAGGQNGNGLERAVAVA